MVVVFITNKINKTLIINYLKLYSTRKENPVGGKNKTKQNKKQTNPCMVGIPWRSSG